MKTLPVEKDGKTTGWMILCPACGNCHYFDSKWTFNGNQESPTFHPSMLVKSGNENGPTVCHSFVRDGKIEFLADCTHDFKNKIVDLQDF